MGSATSWLATFWENLVRGIALVYDVMVDATIGRLFRDEIVPPSWQSGAIPDQSPPQSIVSGITVREAAEALATMAKARPSIKEWITEPSLTLFYQVDNPYGKRVPAYESMMLNAGYEAELACEGE